MVSWDTVCMPKIKGGLGIPSINAMQFAFNCSIIYRMYNSTSPLSYWLSAHYISPWRPPISKASKFWISICNTAGIVKYNFKFTITPSARIALHWDHWCNNHTLAEFVGDECLDMLPYPFLKDYVASGSWVFLNDIPQNLKTAICSFQIHDSAGFCLSWKDYAHVKFSDYVDEFYINSPDSGWHNFIWHKKHMLKHTVYVWLTLVGGLKTQDALRKRNIHVMEICSLCHTSPESVNHLFFECSYSFIILNSLIPGTMSFLLRPTIMQLYNWMENEFSGSRQDLNFYLLMVGCIIYHIWRERNLRRFGNETRSSSTLQSCIKKIISGKVLNLRNADVLLGKL